MMDNPLRRIRNLIKRRLVRPAFELFQRLGVNVTPVHFYSEIPNISELRSGDSWRRAYDLSSLPSRSPSEQLELLGEWLDPHLWRAQEGRIYEQAMSSEGSEGFGPVEAYVLYAFVIHHCPSRIVQVGGGVSTSIMLQALEQQDLSGGHDVRLTCIEPFPSEFLRDLHNDGRIELVEERAQDLDAVALLGSCGAGDLLFVDSSHTTVPGSDVNRIILEWLPSLPPGVWIHFHDIYIPFDYAPGILTRNLFFHRESVLLQAFLTCNHRFQVELSLSLLHHRQQGRLKALLGAMYDPRPMRFGLEEDSDGHFPSSTYLRSSAGSRP